MNELNNFSRRLAEIRADHMTWSAEVNTKNWERTYLLDYIDLLSRDLKRTQDALARERSLNSCQYSTTSGKPGINETGK